MNIWYLAAQVMGLVTITFEFKALQIKEKTGYFKTTAIGSVFWLLMFIFIGLATGMDTQLSLILAGTYSVVRNLVFYVIFKKDTPEIKEKGLKFLLVMVFIAVCVGVFTVISAPPQVRWLHISGIVAAVFFAIGQYMPGVHWVRATVAISALLILLTQTPVNILEGDFRWNIMGILIELSKISSVVVFYIKYLKQPKKPHLTFHKL